MLNKDYPLAGTALEVKTKTPSGVTFRVAGVKTDAAITGDLEGKWSDYKKGLTLTQVSTNTISYQIDLGGESWVEMWEREGGTCTTSIGPCPLPSDENIARVLDWEV